MFCGRQILTRPLLYACITGCKTLLVYKFDGFKLDKKSNDQSNNDKILFHDAIRWDRRCRWLNRIFAVKMDTRVILYSRMKAALKRPNARINVAAETPGKTW